MKELVYKIKKSMEKSGSYSYILNMDTDEFGVDELSNMFDMIWNEPPEFAEEEKKSDPNEEPDSCFPNYIVKQYTLVQHSIPDDLKKKLKELGIKITKNPYGRLIFEADENTIGIAENIYNLKFLERVIKP